jgi:ABC-type transporter Mla MlaB component
LIYDDRVSRDALFSDFLQDGIRRGERTVLVDAGLMDETAISSSAGPGQFDAVSSSETYIRTGRFEADSVLAMLRAERDWSVAFGFSALRTAGEPPVVLRANGCSHQLVEYERSANELFATERMAAVCAYHAPTTAPDAVIGLINAHPVVFFAQRPTYRLRVEQVEARRLALSGWLDVTTMGSMVEILKNAVDAGGDVELELAKIDFVDLAAIRLFAEAAERLSSKGASLILCSAPIWMLEVVQLLDCFPAGLVLR